jgi:hypothetical protein
MEGLEPGRYLVTVSCPAVVSGVTREVEVGEHDVRLDIEIASGVVSGTVLMPNGWPAWLADVRLELVRDGSDRVTDLTHAVFPHRRGDETKDDGTFAIMGVLPGTYSLRVTEDGCAPYVATVVMPPDGDVTDLRIELQTEARVVAEVSSLAGSVPEQLQMDLCDGDGRFVSETTCRVDAATGECLIYGLGPGRHILLATAEGHAPIRKEVSVADDGETRIDLVFAQGSGVTVSVVERGGAPVFGATVLLDGGHDPALEALLMQLGTLAETDEAGHVRFDHLADGNYTLRVRCEGYEDAAVPVRVAGGGASSSSAPSRRRAVLRPRGRRRATGGASSSS